MSPLITSTRLVERLPSTEQIVLFSSSPPAGLADAQNQKKLVCFLKQFEYGLSFSLFHFFIGFYKVSPRMPTPNSILFMRAFKAVCWGQGFRPSVSLFSSFLRITKSNNGFKIFSGRMGLSFFVDHKDSIYHQIESFTIVRLRGEHEWGFDIAQSDVDPFCNAFPHLLEWEQLYYAWLASLPFKYDIFKCLELPPGSDFCAASTYCFDFCASHSFFFLIKTYFCGLEASVILMGETLVPRNFTLFRDFIKQAVEQFTGQKIIEVIHGTRT